MTYIVSAVNRIKENEFVVDIVVNNTSRSFNVKVDLAPGVGRYVPIEEALEWILITDVPKMKRLMGHILDGDPLELG